MKKTFLLLIGFCIVFAMWIPAELAAQTGNLGNFTLVLADNFEYGNGYQGLVTNRNMLNGHRIQPGETYTLKITFTVSRDLENELEIGLVDTTERANWWTSLSWNDAQNIRTARIPAARAGTPVTAELTLTTIAAATGTAGNANALAFMTAGEGVQGKKGSGVKKPVNMVFTEFILTKK